MHGLRAIIPLFFFAACGSEVETPRGGVGFGDYDAYLAEQQRLANERETARVQGVAPGLVVSPESSVAANVEFERPQTPVSVNTPSAAQPIQTTPVIDTLALENAADLAEQPAPVDPNNPNISDEQNFEAVSARETIESDRQRLERQREQFQVIEPTELPKRRGTSAPNIVAYALSSTNSVGQVLYVRGPFNTAATSERNCRKFVTDDLAQEAFLAAGGPERDPKRLDFDGDGFACGWNPAPFRVLNN